MKQTLNLTLTVLALLALVGVGSISGQQPFDYTTTITKRNQVARVAVTDFRGTGKSQPLMNVFNETVWNDLADAGVFDLVAKSVYPLETPQQTSDFRPPVVLQPAKAGDPVETRSQGPWLTDWSAPPVNANYLAFGYAAERPGTLVVYGHFFNVGQQDVRTAQIFMNPYVGSLDEAGAVKVAHEYASDILKQLGVPSLAGSKIWFVSDRSGARELWSMDHDGKNQTQFTRYGTSVWDPGVSPDGKLVGFRVLQKDQRGEHWQLRVHSTETGARIATHRPPDGGTIGSPSFSPDGKMIYYSVSIDGWMQLVRSKVDGSGVELISKIRAIETEPKVNPRTGADLVFTSGRSGSQQVWRSTTSGASLVRVTDGSGYAAQPSWSPDGTHIAFSWTRGYEIGGYNIFVIDVAKPTEYVQLTKGGASFENASWAPDSVHLTYTAQPKGSRNVQVYSMLANGQRSRQLTSQGNNSQPVWAAKIQ